MFGFFFGGLCLIGLSALLWSRPRLGRFGRGCHGRGHGRYGLYGVLDRLDTAPGQEKAILAAVDELRDMTHPLHERVRQSRAELAGALRGDRFDDQAIDGVVRRHSEDLTALGAAFASSLRKVHDALDPEQRRKLARIIESGWGFGPHFA